MMDRTDPTGLRQRQALGIRNRNNRDRRKGRENRLMFRQIKASVQRGHERRRLAGKQREWIVVKVKVQKIAADGRDGSKRESLSGDLECAPGAGQVEVSAARLLAGLGERFSPQGAQVPRDVCSPALQVG